MDDVLYKDGFPPKWAMVHRSDTTLLLRYSDFAIFGGGTVICAAPKLMQGEAWLSTAQEIAHALAGTERVRHEETFAAFCDHCGMGPSCDEEGDTLPSTRATRSWTCYHCDHKNERPARPVAPPENDRQTS